MRGMCLLGAIALPACKSAESFTTEAAPPASFATFVSATPSGISIDLNSDSAYFISPDGNDGNPGSQALPWQTIQHAADSLGPGETAWIRAGTYQESVILTRSGAPDAPITFAAYPGETVILDGDAGRLYAGFQSDSNLDISDIRIQGFSIRDYESFGIVFWSANHRIALADLTLEDNGDQAIRFSNSDGSRVERVMMRGNEGGFDCTPILPGTEDDPGCTNLYIGDVQAINNGTRGDTATDAFSVERGADILVERSLASGGVGDGFDFKSDRTVLSQVIAFGTRNNIKLWGKESVLVNALAYDATADANLVLAAGGSYTVINVTIANMTDTAYLIVAGDPSAEGPTEVVIRNSIFYNDNPRMEGTLLWLSSFATQVTLENNLFFNPFRTDAVICADFLPYNGECFNSSQINGLAFGDNNRYGDPGFIDSFDKDFRLAAGSIAIDTGNPSLAPEIDLLNIIRVNFPDIGAHEFLP